jgi:hypothetical protein
MIQPFDERGSLPAGIHKATWNDGGAKGIVEVDLEAGL